MSKVSILYQVLSSGEAEHLWGLSKGTVKVYCKRGLFLPHEARKSENTWLVTKEGMTRVFGKPNLTQEELWERRFDMIKYDKLEYENQTAIDSIQSYVNSIADLNEEVKRGVIHSEEPYVVNRSDLESHAEALLDESSFIYAKAKTKGKTIYTCQLDELYCVLTAYFRNNQYVRYSVEGVEF